MVDSRVFLALVFPAIACAQPLRMTMMQSDEPPADFSIGYTLGVHRGKVKQLEGSVDFDPATGRFSNGKFTAAISGLDTGSREQDCHLQEALGLDYAASDFPQSHVCEDDVLPKDGPNSVKYPHIEFLWQTTEVGPRPEMLRAVGQWRLHGKSKPAGVDFTLKRLSQSPWRLRLEGNVLLALKDFDIQVKPFLFIRVGDEIGAHFAFDLLETPARKTK